MQVNVRFLDNLRLEASFDDFTIITDQPIRYKGDGTAPSPFDYFLASSALCAAYFVKVYCVARNIPTEDIKVYQNNVVDPNDRYNQIFDIQIELPANINEKDRQGILAAMDRCTVKKVIQTGPQFKINPIDILGSDSNAIMEHLKIEPNHKTLIPGKDLALEDTIQNMSNILKQLGIKIEISSWRNPVPNVWSVHIRDADAPMCYTNGKGSSQNGALCSALGEYLERISNNYFYNDYYLGDEIAQASFVHYPNEKWFKIPSDNNIPPGILDEHCLKIYNPDGELKASHLIDMNSGNQLRGICTLPFIRHTDGEQVHFPVNLIGNLFVSNGMSAGNNIYEARVQALSEIFERAVKHQIIREEIALPDVPSEILAKYPAILAGIKSLEDKGYPVLVKDASLNGRFPVMCVVLMNPRNGGVFASFGAHPKFEVALERSLTELLQGRSFEMFNDLPIPTFNSFAVTEHNNIIDHFIDSTGVMSWRFFSDTSEFQFHEWNFEGNTEQEYSHLIEIVNQLEKVAYIADYNDLGANACRILIPDYSEIYPLEDLIWDNHNKALIFRSDILNIHKLSDNELEGLLQKFDEIELDDYMLISELIGVCFEDTSTWGQLNIGELKAMIYLAVGNHEMAKEYVEQFLTFNDNLAERKKLYQALNLVLDIVLDPELSIKEYRENLSKMYSIPLIQTIEDILARKIRFYGLSETDLNLTGIDKHQRLIKSYKKLHQARLSSKNLT